MPAKSDIQQLSDNTEPSKPDLVQKLLIVENYGIAPELNADSKRGDENEPPMPSVSEEMLRPQKLIYNVACQATLTVDAGISCQTPRQNTRSESRPTLSNSRFSKASSVFEKGGQANESVILQKLK